jgi:hypothetical protein
MLESGGGVYVGGEFSSAGGIPAMGVALWNRNTQSWSALNGGVGGCTGLACTPVVYALALVGSDLYIGGNFTTAGGGEANHIVRYNLFSNTWHAVANGVSGCEGPFCSVFVRAICYSEEYGLAVGGKFIYANNAIEVNNIATWKDNAWHAMGSGTDNTVYAIANPTSYGFAIGGTFTSPFNNLAHWDGSWHSVPTDIVNGAVYAILAFDNYRIYVGGAFTNLGGANGDYLSLYNFFNSLWHGPDSALDDYVYALDRDDPGEIYAGGLFTSSGIVGLNRIGKYEDGVWSGFGSGVDSTVRALVYESPYIYAGGLFLNAGGKPSSFFGRWGMIHQVYLPVTTK